MSSFPFSIVNHVRTSPVPRLPVGFTLACLALFLSCGRAEPVTEAERLFTLEVGPLLEKKCVACHGVDPSTGEEKLKGGFDVRSRDRLIAGGDSVSGLLVPGDSEASFLLDVVRWKDPDYEMPPKENDRLDEEQVSALEEWISQGAPWPSEEKQEVVRRLEREQEVTDDGLLVETSGGLGDSWTYRRYDPADIWAFRAVEKYAVPRLDEGPWRDSGNPIDAFVGRGLAEAGLEPAPRAEPVTLLRRLSFDLTGLPPTPERVDSFLAAHRADPESAWIDEVDRLLASPRYGERWGQHWLDVVRYADTAGYSNDWELSNAWRYRDYVIRSFNSDKPWDRFIVEQLAGDELEPDNPEMRVATGFFRVGAWEHTAMSPVLESRQLFLDETVSVTGQAFLSTAMKCVKCHDHKFDPIPTRDYYRMYAAFATTQPAEMETEYLAEENRGRFSSEREHVEELLAFAEEERDQLDAKRERAAREWYESRDLDYVPYDERKELRDVPKPPRFVGLDFAEQGVLKVREQDARIWERALERFEPLAQAVYNGGDLHQQSRKLRPPDPSKTWRKEMEKSREVPESHILSGGSVYAEGEPVIPGVLSALGLPTATGSEEDPYALPEGMDRRRLELARWIAHPENPLSTRSIVNRVWHYHFGRGIAGNPNNFGATGKKPTHPELLDFLTTRFLEQGWSLKKLHRLILTSETWRMATHHPRREEFSKIDPNNERLWVFEPRPLTAEEMRDSMLAATGELNLEMGGLPIRPEMNREIAFSPRKIQFSLAPAWQPSPTPEERHRRTVYALRIRTLPDPFLQVFHRPGADDSCEIRDTSTVTPQVFSLMNSDKMVQRSIALALRLEAERVSPRARIDRAYRLVFQRAPTEEEANRLARHYEEMVAYHRKVTPEPIEYPTHITRSLVEELSGDAFSYRELLNGHDDFEPDPGPADVAPETRALADIALLLFNANEYLYIY